MDDAFTAGDGMTPRVDGPELKAREQTDSALTAAGLPIQDREQIEAILGDLNQRAGRGKV